jgi:hypothetical protein
VDTTTQTRLAKAVSALAFAGAMLLTPRAANADVDRAFGHVELPDLALAGYNWFSTADRWTSHRSPVMESGRLDPDVAPTFGQRLALTVVARDWSVTHPLKGEDGVVDRLRLTRSTRMAVSRVRMTGGVVVPYLQVGLGQWRVDTDVLPQLPHDEELAAQAGGGFEWRLFPRGVLAAQLDDTVLYRERREPQNIPSTHLYGALLAFRAEF